MENLHMDPIIMQCFEQSIQPIQVQATETVKKITGRSLTATLVLSIGLIDMKQDQSIMRSEQVISGDAE